MSVYLEYPSLVNSGVALTAFAWSSSTILFAAAADSGDVLLVNEEGEVVQQDPSLGNVSTSQPAGANGSQMVIPIVHRPSLCRSLCWHPTSSILIGGWDDGALTVWSALYSINREDLSIHQSAVTKVAFSPDGSRVLSADSSGMLCVSSIDQRGRFQLICKYQKRSPITHLVFRQIVTFGEDGSEQPMEGCPAFLFAVQSGFIYFADDQGHCVEVINSGSELKYFHYNPSADYLVAVTTDAVLYKYCIVGDGEIVQDRKVKLSIKGDGSDLHLVLIGDALLAASNNEGLIRFWHLERDDNYVLVIGIPNRDPVMFIDFNPKSRILSGGTQSGKVIFWKYNAAIIHPNANHNANSNGEVKTEEKTSSEEVEISADDWEVLNMIDTRNPVEKLFWGPQEGILAVSAEGGNLSILTETVLRTKFYQQNSVIQLSSDMLAVQSDVGRPVAIETSMRIKGIDISNKYLLIWNGKKAEIRDMSSLGSSPSAANVSVVSSFATKASLAALHNESVYCVVGSHIEICNLQGVVKSTIQLNESEGNPAHIDITGDFCAVATSNSFIKLWDIGRREPKPVIHSRTFSIQLDGINPAFMTIKAIKINANGNKIAMLCNSRAYAGGVETPDTRLIIYEVELDKMFQYQFGPHHYPFVAQWDQIEEKLISVQTKLIQQQHGASSSSSLEEKGGGKGIGFGKKSLFGEKKIPQSEVYTIFATAEYGLLMQDSIKVDGNQETLIGCEVPNLFFTLTQNLQNVDDVDGMKLKATRMRDFVGLDDLNEEVRKDLLSFSFNLTVGNIDEAYRSVKKISSESIWENMARMCVKTKRLDVAEVCFGNMNNARGAAAIREAKQKYTEKEAQIAAVAIQLNLIEDAEQLLMDCQRFDLLVELYMSCGKWNEAVQLAAQFDRIHLKTTNYLVAKHLESVTDMDEATRHYEMSGTHRYEVPRMLHDTNKLKELQRYVTDKDDATLYKWWGQYMESARHYDEAIQYYKQGKDFLSAVRIHFFLGEINKAIEVCNTTNDPSACYHLGRQFESENKIGDAIKFYKKAKRYGHSIRLAQTTGLDSELLQLALESPDVAPKLDAAKYFEAKQQYDRAVLLYHKGGKLNRAIELCFSANLFDSLRLISENLNAGGSASNTDPQLLHRVAEFFLKNEQYDKSVDLLIAAGKFSAALDLCIEQKVKISDTMAEKMTPPKGNKDSENKDREEFLLKLADVCRQQGSFHLACKKFTQAGDHLKAMKCLLKSADTDKIIYYATMTKKKEIFVLAANYLQTQDWHGNEEIFKKILEFYTKAKAMAQLGTFFNAAAQVEIDEYRDYEKALSYLKEEMKVLIKSKGGDDGDKGDKETQLSELDEKIRLVEIFIDAKGLSASDGDQMVRKCNELLEELKSDSAVRVGDVFALLVEYFFRQQDFQSAYQQVQLMDRRGIVVDPYIDAKVLGKIYKAVGASRKSGGATKPSVGRRESIQEAIEGGVGEEIDEPIAED